MLKGIVDNDPITAAQPKELTSRERVWLVQSDDPVTCASYFDYRFKELKKAWNKSGTSVLSLVKRSKKDALKIKDDSTENDADVCNFVDRITTCEREWDGSPHTSYQTKSTEESWNEIVRRQTHKHTATCKRKRGDQTVRRFNIPFLPMDVTRILRPFNDEEEQIITDQELADFHDGHKRIRR